MGSKNDAEVSKLRRTSRAIVRRLNKLKLLFIGWKTSFACYGRWIWCGNKFSMLLHIKIL